MREGSTWWEREHAGEDGFLVAYFCAEFGLHESLPIYAGGLGVLAGDHVKSADDLGVPLVAVGLLYRHGYFRQRLDDHGRQLEEYAVNDPERLGLILERDDTGSPRLVHVDLAERRMAARIWRADAGRVALYLLDADVPDNPEELRGVTGALYGGDREQRIRQEFLLGVGGVAAIDALGLAPSVFHLNEGHSAFLTLERIRRAVIADSLPVGEAFARVRATTVFTTHTPVPAGNEVFEPQLARRYLGQLAADIGVSIDELLDLGRSEGGPGGFGLTPLALRTSGSANGVSVLHGRVSRAMWAAVWPDRDVEDVPIGAVTNGVHPRTWLAPELHEGLRAAGVWPDAPPDEANWDQARSLDDLALWSVHRRRKEALLETIRGRLGAGADRADLDPEALTIGFARRFATYKRAGLFLTDADRLARLVGNSERPLQVLLAGKAHPADELGKDLIQAIVRFAGDARAAGRIVFLEDYEIALARHLVQGVDVWLNNPRRPEEASGTSGMKAGMNGVLNLSILDGWWAEAFAPEVGWAISPEGSGADDAADADNLYRLLEDEVVPAFYDRDADGLPRRWLAMMKASIERIGAGYASSRMVVDYVERYYLPAHRSAA